jgi:hypothetical protein
VGWEAWPVGEAGLAPALTVGGKRGGMATVEMQWGAPWTPQRLPSSPGSLTTGTPPSLLSRGC